MVQGKKPRLYVALYAGDGVEPDTYHWALTTGPRTDRETVESHGKRFHVRWKRDLGTIPMSYPWEFEEIAIPVYTTNAIRIRVMVAKVLDMDKMCEILREVPVIQNTESWTCRSWIKAALETLASHGGVLGTSCTDWDTIEEEARRYINRKKEEGRFKSEVPDNIKERVATWDLTQGKEIVP